MTTLEKILGATKKGIIGGAILASTYYGSMKGVEYFVNRNEVHSLPPPPVLEQPFIPRERAPSMHEMMEESRNPTKEASYKPREVSKWYQKNIR